jgi:predicted phosphodiesterase
MNLEETQYMYGLCENKKKNKHSWGDISCLMKDKYNLKLSGDFIRHKWYGAHEKDMLDNKDIGNRILCLSDLHIPYQIPIGNIVDKYANKVDILVFNGDEQDCQSISSFPKAYRKSFLDELISTRSIIIDIIEQINPQKVVFIDGNHNKRMITYFGKHLDSDVIQLMPSSNLELIINTGFTKYNHETHTKEYFSPLREVMDKIDIYYDGNYYNQIGKTLFVHPYTFSNSPMKTVEKCAIYFSREKSDFDTIVMGHTHRTGYYRWGEVHLFEQGSLCKEMEYTTGRIGYQQSNGYMYIVQDKEGNLIYDKTKLEVI